jgi:uncharacterized protein YndB with AHSA1/START domain
MNNDTDAIRKTARLDAPLARVWDAVSDSRQFGAWFGAEFDGPFTAGATLTARIRPTTVDPEVARLQAPHAGQPFEVVVTAVEPPHRLAFRWHPHGTGGPDHPDDPMTLVEFLLEPDGGATRVTIVESGFDRIALERRAQAFDANAGGWTHQLRLVGLYVAGAH